MFKIKNSFCKMAVAALFTVIVLASCSPSKPAPQFTLRIGWFPVPDYLPYFVILEQGFDKKNRLQFEEKQYEGGAAILEAMASGLIDGGYIGSVPVLSAAERRLIPDKIVPVAASSFADPDHPLIAVLVAPSVKGWKDLEGKLIAVNAINSLNTAAIKGRLRQEGIRDYKLVEIPFTNVGLALAGGNVPAATILEPFLTQSLLRGDGKLLDWIIGGPPFESFQIVLFVFSGDFYRNNPQAVKAFLRAHLQAVKWINQNPDGARSILTKRLGLSKEVGQKMKLPFWKLDAKNDPILLDKIQPILINVGMLKKPIPAKQLYDETLLEEVLKEKR